MKLTKMLQIKRHSNHWKPFRLACLPIFMLIIILSIQIVVDGRAAIPLAVKTPNLNTWLAEKNNELNGEHINSGFFTNTEHFHGLMRVDGHTFQILGSGLSKKFNLTVARQTSNLVTPTRSIFTLMAENHTEVKLTFYTPIDSSDKMMF